MILGRAIAALAATACICTAAPACADVLEIGDDGSRWIAGGPLPASDQLNDEATAPESGALEEIPSETHVPEEAVANPLFASGAIPDAYYAKVHELARRFDLSPVLIEALVWQESRWRADAVSPVGARGLAQLMPGTARDLGVNPDDPFANLEGGARYLREQLDRFDGDLEKALAAYNAGPARVVRADGVPNIRETKAYVAAVIGRLSDHSRRQ